MNNKLICGNCKQENPINATLCFNCDETIRNYDYYKTDYKKYYELFSDGNLRLLREIPFTDASYDTILNSIVDIGSGNIPVITKDPATPILLEITKPYARVQYDQENKHPGFLSFYSFNRIFLNKTIPHTMIASAILHEFSHHLFNEIIKQAVMHLLNYEKNLYIESFAWYLTLQNAYLQIANEFVSHKVQEYFIPEYFNGYTSLIALLNDNAGLETNKIEPALAFGNSISEDVIFVLEHFIHRASSLANPIMGREYDIGYNIHKLGVQEKIDSLYTVVYKTFELFCKNKRDMLPVIEDLNQSYIYYNI